MRILVVAACPLPWPRGTPIRIHRMAEALVHSGHEVHVATYPLGDWATPTPYTIHRVGRRSLQVDGRPGPSLKKLLVFDPLLVRKVRRLLDEIAFDVIHAHHYEGLIAALMARKAREEVPVVYDAHTLLATELPYYRLPLPAPMVARLGRWLDTELPRRADHIIAVTDGMRQWLITEGTVSDSHVSIIQNGVEHEHFPAPRRRAAHPGSPRIVYSGNLAEYQGIELLLLAFQKVRATLPQATLSLVTDPSGESLQARAETLGLADCVSIVRADYASLPCRLAEADVLVNPRPSCDGLPQKLLNYMASGRPIVSFVGSAALLEHERTALLVPDEDIDAFAGAITRVLQHPELGQRLGRAARAEVIAARGWEQVAARVERVYSKVTGRQPGFEPCPRSR